MDSFTALRSADFSGSNCYAEIINWAELHPDVCDQDEMSAFVENACARVFA